jgi:glyoxylase-like metal-dependent hydrolase (beta-lactamase superfamily II)
MTKRVLVAMALVLLLPALAWAQDGRAALESAARALGAPGLKSIEIKGSGSNFALGQSHAPGAPWPRFNLKSFTRTVNYETASMRDDLVRTQAEDPPRGGGVQPVRGEQRQVFLVRGDDAWNVTEEADIPAPMAVADRQMQLWLTPHGVVKAALASNAGVQGRTVSFAVPSRFTAKAFLDRGGLVERVEAVLAHPVVGDLPVQVAYFDYQDFGGVKFPTKIRQWAGGFPTLDLTITEVRPNAAADIETPLTVRGTTGFYARVANQMVADGVWYITGGSHHSVAIEMDDHLIVVEGPLNDERALAVIEEVRSLVPAKPIRYVVNTHHHYDHAGGLRAFAGEGVTIITHDVNRPFFEHTLAAPATVDRDHLARSGRPSPPNRKATVEGVRDRRVLTDGTRVVELHHIAGNQHHEGLLLVYLPKEKMLVEADAFTPGPANVPPVTPASPYTVNLADTVARLGLAVDQILPLHGRSVPFGELARSIGRAP